MNSSIIVLSNTKSSNILIIDCWEFWWVSCGKVCGIEDEIEDCWKENCWEEDCIDCWEIDWGVDCWKVNC